jgi:short subunit fatty acids transporter
MGVSMTNLASSSQQLIQIVPWSMKILFRTRILILFSLAVIVSRASCPSREPYGRVESKEIGSQSEETSEANKKMMGV